MTYIITQIKLLLLLLIVFTISIHAQSLNKADTASNAMVVTAHPEASQIGLEILKMGGNAVDAAVAAAFVIGVVEPYASGLGGGGAMLIRLSDDNTFHYLDYYMETPALADTNFSDLEIYTARSICIPGTPHGLITAVQKYGRLTPQQVIAPAIRIARQGIVVNEQFHTILLDKLGVILQFPETQALYYIDDFPPVIGDTLYNEPLVDVLQNLAEKGADYFYSGEYARLAVQDIKEAGGYITLNDFREYRTVEKYPVEADFLDYHLFSAAAPQSGTTLLEILNLFEVMADSTLSNFDEDSKSIHLLTEAMKRADVDRFHYLSDPIDTNIPSFGLVDQHYAVERFSDFNWDSVNYRKGSDIPVGDPWKFEPSVSIPQKDMREPDRPNTTHISVVDKDGNAVSLTQTLGLYFGSGFTSQGVVYNCSMSNFYKQPSPNRLKGNRRPLSTICPTIVTKGDSIVGIIGTPGGSRLFNVMAQMIIRIFLFNENPVEAMNAPRFAMRASQSTLSLENRFSADILQSLQNLNYKLKFYPDFTDYFGGVQMIIYDTRLKQYIGVSDPRRTGAAAGY
ncbi:MAG: gamma-glutamyltransferase [Calditrichaceae bacterium]|nr:gamma-glutamyltransferase [Calditrichaceae bacterium]